MNPNGNFDLTNKHSRQIRTQVTISVAIFLLLHAVNTAITRPEANYSIVVPVLKLPVGISDGLWFMLVLLEDVGFIVYHSCHRSREVIGNSVRVRSEICFASPHVQSPSRPEENWEKYQDRQFTCNVTPRRPRATFVAVGKQKVLHILSVCYVAFVIQYAARMCQVVIRGLLGSTLRFHIIWKKARFSKKKYWTQNVVWFSVQLLSVIFLILRITDRNIIKNVRVYWSSCKKTPYSGPILMKLEFSPQVF
jgi:hypothetical protein